MYAAGIIKRALKHKFIKDVVFIEYWETGTFKHTVKYNIN